MTREKQPFPSLFLIFPDCTSSTPLPTSLPPAIQAGEAMNGNDNNYIPSTAEFMTSDVTVLVTCFIFRALPHVVN